MPMKHKLPIGKINPTILEKVVLKRLGAKRSEVVFGPKIGGDAAALKMNDCIIVVKVDPIIGAKRRIGRLAVNVVLNDIACLGAEPIALMLTILLPEGSDVQYLEEIVEEAHREAIKANVAIVGGHTEVTLGLKDRPAIVIASGMGRPVLDYIIPSDGAKANDAILMTKTAGIEGTAIIAEDFKSLLKNRVPDDVIMKASSLYDETSVVKEALTLTKARVVHAMHDPTDGGVLEGLYEMAEASNLGFIVWEDRIPIAQETRIITEALNIDPLKLISSGTLLAAIPRNVVDLAISALKSIGIRATIIGYFKENRKERVLVRKSGEEIEVNKPVIDELWRIHTQSCQQNNF